MLVALAVTGWLAAAILAGVLWRHRCPSIPGEAITHLLMVDTKGWPESLRALRSTTVPKELTRAHGKHTATHRYGRTGTAAVYQDKG